MICLEKTIDEYVESGIPEHIAVRVGQGNHVIYDTYRGGVDETTLFDMASVTKIMVTTSLALIALDNGLLNLEDKVHQFYSTSKPFTIKNLLTHTIGIGHKSLNKEGSNYANIAEKILDIPSDIPIGTEELVAKPLGFENTSFLPSYGQNTVNANLNEEKRGIVNDYNCQFLGGIAGNAGLFSNLSDVTKYVEFIQNRGKPLIKEKTFLLAAHNHTAEMSESRGLGYLYVDGRYKQTGGLFEDGAIGHCGHTGQSVFVDYRSGLYVIILSDATISTVKKYGNEHYNEVMDMRARLHSAIKCDLQELSF